VPDTRESSTGERRALREAREEGPLEVSPEVRRALERMLAFEQQQSGGSATISSVLSLEAVDTLEDYLRARMPDDALAVFASRPLTLADFDLARVGALSESAWESGLRKARIVLGAWGKHLVCIPRRPERGHPLRVTFYDPEDQTESNPSSLAEWLDRVFESVMDAQSGGDEIDLDLEGDGAGGGGWDENERAAEALAWTPRLERTLVLPTPGIEKAGRRVRHARFGVGVVRRALPEGDKLEIDFGDAGVKVLVAKYVEELDGG
jgi:hypothetical protein